MTTGTTTLRVSDNGRFLAKEDGTPFSYLADTAWALFHRLSREEADLYLEDRAAKGFTVVQSCLMSAGKLEGLGTNVYGHRPLLENDPTRPNAKFLGHVDYVVNKARSLGLYVGLLPTWGYRYVAGRGGGPRLFDTSSARVYGEFLGKRYSNRSNVIWILGGDVPAVMDERDDRPVWRAMAEGLTTGHQGRHLMTYHPRGGGQTSSTWFHEDAWLAFNMMQTGPRRDFPNYSIIAEDYKRTPIKPTMDGEPGYEGAHPEINPVEGRLTDWDARKYAYWFAFAGAHGHTYGCLEVWQFWHPGRRPLNGARIPWGQALHLPGARQMQYLRRLIESRPFFARVPDQSLIVGEQRKDANYVVATRGNDGSYALVYIPLGHPVEINMEKISSDTAQVQWYDPRTGTAIRVGAFPAAGIRSFTPPSSGPGNDWVLVLDNAARGFSAPGEV